MFSCFLHKYLVPSVDGKAGLVTCDQKPCFSPLLATTGANFVGGGK